MDERDQPARLKRAKSKLPSLYAADAATRWLEGRPLWLGAVIVLESQNERTHLESAVLSRTQRRLYKIKTEVVESGASIPGFDAWMERRLRLLQKAKTLALLRVSDLDQPAGGEGRSAGKSAGHRDQQQISRAHLPNTGDSADDLCLLLVGEALCINSPPVYASLRLEEGGEASLGSLTKTIESDELPPEARCLAALVMGSVHRRMRADKRRQLPSILSSESLRRCYYFGIRYGGSRLNRVFACLLRSHDGLDLAEGLANLVSASRHLSLPPDVLRLLLSNGLSPSETLAAAAAVSSLEPLADSLWKFADLLPSAARNEERYLAYKEMSREREQCIECFRSLAISILTHTGRTESLQHFAQVMERILRFTMPTLNGMKILTAIFVPSLLLECTARPTLRTEHDMRNTARRAPTRREDSRVAPAQEWSCATPAEWNNLLPDYLGILAQNAPRLFPGQSARPPSWSRRRRESDHAWLVSCLVLNIEPLINFLADTKDPALAEKALRLGSISSLPELPLSRLKEAIDFCLDLNMDASVLPSADGLLCRLKTAERTKLIARKVRELSSCNCHRTHVFQALTDIVMAGGPSGRELDQSLELVNELSHLLHHTSGSFYYHELAECFVRICKQNPVNHRAIIRWLSGHFQERFNTGSQAPRLEAQHACESVMVSSAICLDDLEQFKTMLLEYPRIVSPGQKLGIYKQSLEHIRQNPALMATIRFLLPQRPRRCVALINNTALAHMVWKDELDLFARLDPPEGEAADDSWNELLTQFPDLAGQVADLVHCWSIAGRSRQIPESVHLILHKRETLTRELQQLEKLAVLPNAPPGVRQRAHNLKVLLAACPDLTARVRRELVKKLRQLRAEARLEAAEKLLEATYRRRLESLVGELSPDLTLDDDLFSAILLWSQVVENKRTLKRIILEHCRGQSSWVREHQKNREFLEKLAASGADVETWLGLNRRAFKSDAIAGGVAVLYLENDPIKILRMGDHFGTCLSVGDINAFSTIANAVELNKRVVYAKDTRGRIIGRKLIAVNEKFELVAFDTYTSLPDGPGNKALARIISAYCRMLARHAGIRLGRDGEVETLFCESWYDDGITGWQDEEDVQVLAAISSCDDTSSRTVPHKCSGERLAAGQTSPSSL